MRLVSATIVVVAVVMSLLGFAAADSAARQPGDMECWGDRYVWTGAFALLALLAYTLIGVAIAAAVIGASERPLRALISTAALIVVVAGAIQVGWLVGTALDGCELIPGDDRSLFALAAVAALIGAVPGCLLGMAAGWIRRRARRSPPVG
jgi:hypothetical protein